MKEPTKTTPTKKQPKANTQLNWIAWTLIAILLSGLLASILLATVNGKWQVQKLDYSEITDDIINPDQGFYRTSGVKIKRDGTATLSCAHNADTQVFHLRVDISDLSGKVNGVHDYEIEQSALDKLDEALDSYKVRSQNVIIRFCYDPGYSGKADMEADVSMILTHIRQLSKVLNKYQITLTAIEAGLIGPWGEMHTSKLANKDTFNKIIDAWLKYTDEIPILVRTPAIIYNYLGITVNDIETATIPEHAYRLGLFNDGYLGSGSDLGTYTNREKETQFLSKQTAHLPYGGEVTVPDSTWHDIDKCLPEMFLMNLSYLNYEWNTYVVQTKWKETFYTRECGNDELWYGKTAFDYIKNHLGYRLVLTNSQLRHILWRRGVEVKLSISNVGFGNLNRTKNITIYLVNSEGEVIQTHAGSYSGGDLQVKAKLSSLQSGKYEVYVGINTLENGETSYPIRFANNLWNDDLKANYVGQLKI